MLERGRNGIEIIVRMVILQLMPTVVEVALIVGVLFWQFDWRYVGGHRAHGRRFTCGSPTKRPSGASESAAR